MCSLSVIEIIKITTVIGSFGQGRKEGSKYEAHDRR